MSQLTSGFSDNPWAVSPFFLVANRSGWHFGYYCHILNKIAYHVACIIQFY